MQCEVTSPAITHWKKRFVAHALAGLHDEARPGRPRTHDDEAVAELLAKVLHEKPAGATHWSVRCAAAQTGISKSSVARYLSLFGVQPQTFKVSPSDPREKREDYRHPSRRSGEPARGLSVTAGAPEDSSHLSRRPSTG